MFGINMWVWYGYNGNIMGISWEYGYSICYNMDIWLVVWNMNFMTFHSVGNVIIPTDELIFFRWVGIPPTSIYIYNYNYWGTHVDPDFLSGVGSTPPIPGHWIFTHKAENFSRAVGFDALTSEHGDGSKWLTFKQMVSHTDWWMPKRLDCFFS